MNRLAFLLAAVLAACAAAPPGATGAVAAPDPRRGLDIADRNCSLCHAIGADGDSRHPNAPRFRDLATRGYPLDYLGPALAGGIGAGHLGMPLMEFDEPTLADLRAYMATLAEDRAPNGELKP